MKSFTPRDISSLSPAELQLELVRCTRLKERLSLRLPDGGAKLTTYLDQLTDALSNRPKSNEIKESPRPFSIVDNKGQRAARFGVAKAENLEREFGIPEPLECAHMDISDQFATLSIKPPSGAEPESDLTDLPKLTFDELSHLQSALNLPILLPSSWHWFTFSFRFIGKWVYLTVFDCSSIDRYLFRSGLRAFWFPQVGDKGESFTSAGNPNPPSQLHSPTEAVSDLWQFITAAVDEAKPVVEASIQTTVPCLICSSVPSANTTDLVWFSRLLRTTRHSAVTRTVMPRDCRFVDVATITTNITSEVSQSDSTEMLNTREILVSECRLLAQSVLTKSSTSSEGVKPKLFKTVYEFFRNATTRGLPWMEAPLELHALRQLKACGCDPSLPLSPRPEGSPDLNNVPDHILRRLAAVGLGRARLIRLVGQYGWHGFAGLLTFSASAMLDSEDEKRRTNNSRALVTSDLETVRHLYRFFHHVHRRLERHARLREEQRDVVARSHPWKERHNLRTLAHSSVCPNTLQAWTASGNPILNATASERRLLCLNMDTSIHLMQKTYKEYQDAYLKYPRAQLRMPPPSDSLYSPRDESFRHPYLKSTDSLSESSSSDSETSLHLEDVD